jgi:hypothetical protein
MRQEALISKHAQGREVRCTLLLAIDRTLPPSQWARTFSTQQPIGTIPDFPEPWTTAGPIIALDFSPTVGFAT